MIISTMNDLPGYEVHEVLGEVFGLTIRSRNMFSNLGAGLKSLVGGELKGMTKNLEASRQEVIQRMAEAAAARGGNAVIAMRFDTSEMGDQWTEICAYGTAVKVAPRAAGLAPEPSGFVQSQATEYQPPAPYQAPPPPDHSLPPTYA
jgi:uncharacterized protein YbjQ (UPF0145 family)